MRAFYVLCTATSLVLAASSGLNTTCDAVGSWGCYEYKNGDRKMCVDQKPGIMPWVAAPVRSTSYSVRTGDGDNNLDPTTYKPGKLMNIFVRTLNYTAKFRGIIIQAVDARGAIVGDFRPASQETRLVHTPCANPGVALHMSAEIKPFLLRLRWRAPVKGTGTVTFKCLVKEGPPNHGYFWYPNREDLTIAEGAEDPVATQWYETKSPQLCSDFCFSNNKQMVDHVAMGRVAADPVFYAKEICTQLPCVMPLISFCGNSTEPFQSNGLFYYRDSQCETWRAKPAILPSSAQRVCPCRIPPTPPPTPPLVSAAESKVPTRFWLASVIGLFVIGSNRPLLTHFAIVMVSCFLYLAPTCEAHNWLHTTGRATRVASTVRPCMARKASDTHVQVGPGQEFSVKWDTGHGGDSYFAIIAGKNYEKLADKNIMQYIDEYIAEGAAVSANQAFDQSLMRYHGTNNGNLTGHTNSGLFEREVSNQTIVHPTSKQKTMFMYKRTAIQRDVRMSYKSAKHPWLEAVMRYEHNGFVGSPDAVNLTIPGFAGFGHYVVWWSWSGFTDCVDVDYLPQQVPPDIIYGMQSVPASFVWNRIDHCQYQIPKQFMSPCLPANEGVDECLQQHIYASDGRFRAGIQVTPVENPATVFPAFRNQTNIPWFHAKCADTPWLRADGKITTSPDPWDTWKSQTTFETNKTCSMQWTTRTSTFREAVLFCSDVSELTCAGFSWVAPTASLDAAVLNETASRAFYFCKGNLNDVRPGVDYSGRVVAWKSPVSPVSQTPVGPLLQFTIGKGVSSDWLSIDRGVFGARNGTTLKYGWKCTNSMSSFDMAFDHNCDGEILAQDPNYWQVEVPNGVYRVTANHFCESCPYMTINSCTMGNILYGTSATYPAGSWSNSFFVEVVDGKFTANAGYQMFPNHAGGSGCSFFRNFTMQKVQESLPPVWMPSSSNPWKQMQIDSTRPVGMVALKAIPTTTCALWWLARSNTCPSYTRPYSKVFDGSEVGLVVGVSNTSCIGQTCGGKICGKVTFPWVGDSNKVFFNPQDTNVYGTYNLELNVDCKGLVGKYVYVQAPGKNRILSVPLFSVNYARPLPRPDRVPTLACYGVWPRTETNTEPEYITTDDPEDPVFYSTCYVRENNVTWLSGKVEPTPPEWKLDQKCVTCSAFENGKVRNTPLVPPIWEVTDRCIDCNQEKQTNQSLG